MKSKRDLDALIAEKVIGMIDNSKNPKEPGMWRIMDYYADGRPALAANFPSYSTNIEAAWEVVEAMNRSEAYEVDLKLLYDGMWFCSLRNAGNNNQQGHAHSDSAAEAICRAALRAVGAE